MNKESNMCIAKCYDSNGILLKKGDIIEEGGMKFIIGIVRIDDDPYSSYTHELCARIIDKRGNFRLFTEHEELKNKCKKLK